MHKAVGNTYSVFLNILTPIWNDPNEYTLIPSSLQSSVEGESNRVLPLEILQ